MAERITVADITWGLSPAPVWPPSDDVLQAAIELLPTIEDDTAADLIEGLALALADAREQIAAGKSSNSVTLKLLNTEGTERRRLRQRLDEVLDAQRAAKAVA